jgi:hypothetical protein
VERIALLQSREAVAQMLADRARRLRGAAGKVIGAVQALAGAKPLR